MNKDRPVLSAFALRGFASDSWAFLLLSPAGSDIYQVNTGIIIITMFEILPRD